MVRTYFRSTSSSRQRTSARCSSTSVTFQSGAPTIQDAVGGPTNAYENHLGLTDVTLS